MKKEKLLISVIVPVYKVPESYLNKCIDSIMGQTLENIEIILVDDGSPDHCGEICDLYAAKESRISVIHKSNEGVSKARNVGIEKAEGLYIMFLDADDWIEDTTLEEAVAKINEYRCDVVGWNHFYNGRNEIRRKEIAPDPVCYSKKDITRLMFDMISPEYDRRYRNISLGAIRGVWGKLYKASIIKKNNIRFDERLGVGEDACFNINYLKYTNKACFFNSYLNHYRVYEDSENRRFREDIAELRISLLRRYFETFECMNLCGTSDFATCYSMDVLSCVVNCLKRYVCNKENRDNLQNKLLYIKRVLDNEMVSNIRELSYDKHFFTVSEKMLLVFIKRKMIIPLYILGLFIVMNS